jgi:hypothetical protein
LSRVGGNTYAKFDKISSRHDAPLRPVGAVLDEDHAEMLARSGAIGMCGWFVAGGARR